METLFLQPDKEEPRRNGNDHLNLYSASSIVGKDQSKRLWWAEHVTLVYENLRETKAGVFIKFNQMLTEWSWNVRSALKWFRIRHNCGFLWMLGFNSWIYNRIICNNRRKHWPHLLLATGHSCTYPLPPIRKLGVSSAISEPQLTFRAHRKIIVAANTEITVACDLRPI